MVWGSNLPSSDNSQHCCEFDTGLHINGSGICVLLEVRVELVCKWTQLCKMLSNACQAHPWGTVEILVSSLLYNLSTTDYTVQTPFEKVRSLDNESSFCCLTYTSFNYHYRALHGSPSPHLSDPMSSQFCPLPCRQALSPKDSLIRENINPPKHPAARLPPRLWEGRIRQSQVNWWWNYNVC